MDNADARRDAAEPPGAGLTRLAVAARAGDRSALASLLRSLQDTLYRFCRARLGDDGLAHDATQETAMRLVRQIADFRGDSTVTTWVLGVAVNVCREQLRKRTATATAPQWFDERPAATIGPADRVATLESVETVRRLVQQLPERQCEAVTLRYLEQLSVAETAEVMACSQGTVKAAAWQGLRALRTQLEANR